MCEGLPVLRLDSSGENGDKNATYARGNGTAELVFEYEASENKPALGREGVREGAGGGVNLVWDVFVVFSFAGGEGGAGRCFV